MIHSQIRLKSVIMGARTGPILKRKIELKNVFFQKFYAAVLIYLLKILCTIYVPFLYRERFRIKRRKKKKDKRKRERMTF